MPNFTQPYYETDSPDAGGWRTYDSHEWGGHGQSVDAHGRGIYGTDDASVDASRYDYMGQNPDYATGPQMEGQQESWMRGMQDDGMGLMAKAAQGDPNSVAIQAGRAQSLAAQNAQQSMASSARGGPMAQAAAARQAQANASDIGARQGMQERATMAGEMAAGRNAYANAANQQHQQDINYGTTQAQLDAQQRAQNSQNEQYYSRLGWDTKNAQLGQHLGRTQAQNAAANANQAVGLAEDQAAWNNAKTGISTGLGAAQGGIAAYQMTQAKTNPDPSDPYSTSDERAKEDIKPVSDSEAAWISSEADKMAANPGYQPKQRRRVSDAEAERLMSEAGKMAVNPSYQPKATAAPKRVSDAKAAELSKWADNKIAGLKSQAAPAAPYAGGIYRELDDSWSPSSAPMGTEALHAAIAHQIAVDRAAPAPAAPPPSFAQTPHGYAASRIGRPGAMFGPGPAPEAYYGAFDNGAGTGAQDLYAGLAPGTADAQQLAFHRPDAFTRNVMRSDSRAKKAAWDEGHAAALENIRDLHQASPEELKKYAAPEAKVVQEMKRAAYEEGANAADIARAQQAMRAAVAARPEIQPATAPGSRALGSFDRASDKVIGGIQGSVDEGFDRATDVVMPPPRALEAPAQGGVAAQVAAAARARAGSMRSDERSKTVSDHSPMAGANRAMEASLYRYKPGLGPSTQHEGEINVGPMAQNMAADPVARVAIVTEPDTGLLAIDKDKGLKLVMGGLASLQGEVDDMKKKRRP